MYTDTIRSVLARIGCRPPHEVHVVEVRAISNRSAPKLIERLPVFRGKACLQRELDRARKRISALQKQPRESETVPENMVWIVGSGRTGSTWLGKMMGEPKGYALWNEPQVGSLFGRFYYEQGRHLGERKHFALGGDRETWTLPVRRFILNLAVAKRPGVAGDPAKHLIVKEPNGSIGAPLIMEAIPESKMIFLVRDPRHTVASKLDGRRPGGWNRRANEKGAPRVDEDTLAENLARGYLRDISRTGEAYETHEGPKVKVRYEDLKDDTLVTMKGIYSALNLSLDEDELERVVAKHSWDNIPTEDKGPGKLRRKAKPGGWEEDLTPEQVESVEKVTAPIMSEFHPGGVS